MNEFDILKSIGAYKCDICGWTIRMVANMADGDVIVEVLSCINCEKRCMKTITKEEYDKYNYGELRLIKG